MGDRDELELLGLKGLGELLVADESAYVVEVLLCLLHSRNNTANGGLEDGDLGAVGLEADVSFVRESKLTSQRTSRRSSRG